MPVVSANEFYDALEVWVNDSEFSVTEDGDFTDYYAGDVVFAYREALPDGAFRYWVRKDFD